MIPRLHLPGAASGALIDLAEPQFHYLGRVLRLRSGASLQVFDGHGRRFAAELAALDARRGRVRIGEPLPALADGALRVTLVQGLSAADRMDWTIEKAVELGVTTIVPLACERSQVRLDAGRAARRHEHWQRLIVAACMQCGRDRLPGGLRGGPRAGLPAFPAPPTPPPPPALQELPDRPDASRLLLVAPEQVPDALPLSRWQPPAAEPAPLALTLVVGPESGFSDQEIALLRQRRFTPVTLGPRGLRAMPAGMAAMAALQVKFGDF